ncbi:hypothetical protein PCC8801_0018 [Rippkaea orientalis PCC 8801]|uniref:Uncharacterized protein n=1 Tax=Rippkaea orientalis (strain PCC 8801 / RF-1) TaxID=41431 RepID=B7JZG5_RIPO1|nr:hypothetical protein [Rippkaea orientalis]ACK64125.1 hypothetical protein PCC8801_0018 [Rippkaea orientalis PCC 8801]
MMINLQDKEIRQKFLQCNYSILASCFWHYYQEQGKGLLVISYDKNESLNIDYKTDLSDLFSSKTLENKIYPKLKSYNPEQELLVAFQLPDNGNNVSNNCILHSVGSTNFPIKVAIQITQTVFNKISEVSLLS